VLKTKESHWILNVSEDQNFPRAKFSTQSKIYAGFCFPIIANGEVVFLMEFFTNEILAANKELLRVFNEIGRLIGLFISSKKMEEQLHESFQFQKMVLNSTDYSIISTGVDGTITGFNKGSQHLLGYTEEELVGKKSPVVFHDKGEVISRAKVLSKELKGTIKPGFGVFVAKANLGEIDVNEWTYISKSGKRFPMEVSVTALLDESNNITGYLGVGKNLTDHKNKMLEIEQLTNALDFEIKAISNSVLRVEFDIDQKVINANKNFLKLTNYKAKDFKTLSHSSLIADEEKEQELDEHLWNDLRNGISQQGLFKRLTKNGAVIWVRGSYIPVVNNEGGINRIIQIAYDVTDTILTQEQLIDATFLAKKATVAKDDFLANMSHEIRTPMNAIVGFTELIDATDTSEEQQEYLDSIKSASSNLLTIINDILDFAKIESGQMEFNEIPFYINDALSQTKRMMSTLASDKGLKLQFYTDTDIKHKVLGDEGRLNQVLINLVGNAIKFTEKGKIEVFTSLLNETDSSYNIGFSIHDTGIGISEDKLLDIFDRFTQAERYTKRKYGGTGLGLSISKKIIMSLNGELDVTSTLGKGSNFSFSIEFPKNKNQEVIKKTTLSTLGTSISGSRVLLVEDNQLNQLLVKKILTPEGVHLTIASDGKEGVDLISAATVQFDVVLMDLQMPIMNGYEATKCIREELESNVPILAMTAHSLLGEQKKCFDLSMNEYISKPYTKEELITKISQYISPQENVQVVQADPTNTNELFDEIRNLAGGDEDFMKEVIAVFLKNDIPDVKELVVASQKVDYEKMSKLAHKLKSSFGMFGLTKAFDLVSKLEHYDQYSGALEMKKDVEALNTISDAVSEQLKEYSC
jgi:PAS domain S-box-containing protein